MRNFSLSEENLIFPNKINFFVLLYFYLFQRIIVNWIKKFVFLSKTFQVSFTNKPKISSFYLLINRILLQNETHRYWIIIFERRVARLRESFPQESSKNWPKNFLASPKRILKESWKEFWENLNKNKST